MTYSRGIYDLLEVFMTYWRYLCFDLLRIPLFGVSLTSDILKKKDERANQTNPRPLPNQALR